jgi:hypothetical protein
MKSGLQKAFHGATLKTGNPLRHVFVLEKKEEAAVSETGGSRF